MRLVAALFALPFAACTLDPAPLSVACTSRFDCAGGETCRDGVCLAMTPSNTRPGPKPMPMPMPTAPDAGVEDASPATDAEVAADAQTGPSDAGCEPAVRVGAAAYCTIGAAIAAAPVGATVEIPAGTWEESLSIDKTLTLQGSGEATTIHAAAQQVVITIRGTDVAVNALTLLGNGGEGMQIAGSAALQDVAIKATTGAGLRVFGTGASVSTTRVLVSGVHCANTCDVEDWGEGIVFGNGTTGQLADTTIEDTDFIGLYIEGAQVAVTNGRILRSGRTYCGNNYEACTPGVYLLAGATGMIGADTWVQESGGSGIEVFRAAVDVRNSRIERNGANVNAYGDGFYLEEADATLDANQINRNLTFGLDCINGADVVGCDTNGHEENGEGWTNGGCSGC